MGFNAAEYLDRIEFEEPLELDLSTLGLLQLRHLENVPFENLDVFHRRGVTVDQASSVEKVLSGRGGWCFELNGAFGWLLRSLGFSVDFVACAVLLDDDQANPTDHLALVVHLDRLCFLVDVGFGASFTRPIQIGTEEVLSEDDGDYRLVGTSQPTLEFRERNAPWLPQYMIDFTPRQLSEFDPRSSYFQTEPGLKWVQAPFATRLLRNGRVTLLKDTLKIVTRMGTTEFPVTPEEWPVLLSQWFSMDDSLERINS